MKNKLILITSLLAFWGCSNDDIDTIDASLEFHPLVSFYNDKLPNNEDNFQPYLQNPVNISIYYDDTLDNTNNYFNSKWLLNGNNWESNLRVSWKDENTMAHVCAYAPYIDNINNLSPFSYSVKINQTNNEDYVKSDLLSYAEDIIPSSLKDGILDIDMSHALSQLKIVLNFKSSYDNAKTVQEIKIMAKVKSVFNPKNGNITLSDENNDIVEVIPNTLIEGKEYKAIIPSQSFNSKSDFLLFKIDGKDYSYKVPEDVTYNLTKGKTSIINLIVGKNDITCENISINDWIEDVINIGLPGNWRDDASLEKPSISDDYYIINRASELAWVAKNLNISETGTGQQIKIKLNNDIDLSGYYWIPFNVNNQDLSVFDGNGKTISNMTVLSENDKIYRGLFGVVKNLYVKNLNLNNSTVIASDNVAVVGGKQLCESIGVIAGKISSSKISNVHVYNALVNTSTYGITGGLVGEISSKSFIYASSVDSKISIPNSVTADDNTIRVGSLCGLVSSSAIVGCYSSGEIVNGNENSFINALCGASQGLNSTKLFLDACYTTAKLNNIVGLMYVTTKDIGANAIIKNSYMNAPASEYGMNETINNDYNSIDLSVNNDGSNLLKISDLTDKYIYFKNEESYLYPFITKKP